MMYERSAPEAPTSEPVMISSVFDSMKPAAAAAHPEYEFSIATTTGMSPPPMAATRCQPTAMAIAVMIASGTIDGLAMNQAIRPRQTATATRLRRLRAGRVSGADLIFAASLRQATIDPVSVMAPMKT